MKITSYCEELGFVKGPDNKYPDLETFLGSLHAGIAEEQGMPFEAVQIEDHPMDEQNQVEEIRDVHANGVDNGDGLLRNEADVAHDLQEETFSAPKTFDYILVCFNRDN